MAEELRTAREQTEQRAAELARTRRQASVEALARAWAQAEIDRLGAAGSQPLNLLGAMAAPETAGQAALRSAVRHGRPHHAVGITPSSSLHRHHSIATTP